MAKNKWAIVAGVLLLAALITGFILFQQRNHARRQWQDSQGQVNQLNQEIVVLNESSQKQKDQLSARSNLLQKKQLELDTTHKQLRQAHDQIIAHQEKLSALAKKKNDLSNECQQLSEEYQSTIVSLKEQVSKLNQKLTDLETEIKILEAKLTDKDNKLIEAQASYQALKTETESLRKDLYAAENSAGNLEAHQRTMKATYESLLSGLKKQLDSKDASIEAYREKLKVTFVDQILFGFSQVRISSEGEAALNRLADVLATVQKGKISIIGHADNIPIAEKYQYRFPSNWELSSARAAVIARYLLEYGGLDPSKIEVIGRSQYQPLAQNDTQAGRAKNRRVEIIIKYE